MPLIPFVVMVLRLTVWSPSWTVRTLVWRKFAGADPFLGFKASFGGMAIRRGLAFGARRGWWSRSHELVRAVETITNYDRVLHAEITRRHLWRPAFAASVAHDSYSFFVASIQPRLEGRRHVEFQTADGTVDFWTAQRRRWPPGVAGGARYQSLLSPPVLR